LLSWGATDRPPERLAEHLKAEQARFREVIARTNLKPE
jgi:hypothetical protein